MKKLITLLAIITIGYFSSCTKAPLSASRPLTSHDSDTTIDPYRWVKWHIYCNTDTCDIDRDGTKHFHNWHWTVDTFFYDCSWDSCMHWAMSVKQENVHIPYHDTLADSMWIRNQIIIHQE